MKLFPLIIFIALSTLSIFAHAQDSTKYPNHDYVYYINNSHFVFNQKLLPMKDLKYHINTSNEAMVELNKSLRYKKVVNVSTIVFVASLIAALRITSSNKPLGENFSELAIISGISAGIFNPRKKKHLYKAICIYNQAH